MFYHHHDWDSHRLFLEGDKRPLVAVEHVDEIILCVLKVKPYQLEKAMNLKDTKEKDYSFKAPKGTWCLKVDVLVKAPGVAIDKGVFVRDINVSSHDILVPVYAAILPVPLPEPSNWHAYFNISSTPAQIIIKPKLRSK